MKYITVSEAAKKWNISIRQVQKYCSTSRIPGAIKFGNAWSIPHDAPKPQDLRNENLHSSLKIEQNPDDLFAHLMPLLNASFKIGHCKEYIHSIKDKTKHNLSLAEYYYFSGQPEQCVEMAELYLTFPNPAIRLSACLLYGYANLSIGHIHHAKYALGEIKKTLSTSVPKIPEIDAIESFISITAAVLLHLPLPAELPPINSFISLLPPGLRIFSLYVYAHYLYLQKEYQKSIGVVEATFTFGAQKFPIPSIYLHLILVMDYIGLKQTDEAKEHFLIAWNLARPDDLIQAFGEHHGLLGGMLETIIKSDWPHDFKRIISITYHFSSGWRQIHNSMTGNEIADTLTTTEFTISMLAARGWTNQEIAQHMNISHNTVKKHISTAMAKLGVARRSDLQKHMLS